MNIELRKFKKIIITTLLFLVLMPSCFLLNPAKVDAAIPVTVVWDVPLTVKELGLDTLARSLATALLHSLTNSIVNWINSGFEGNPTFVDPDTFLTDVADQASGAFIKQVGLEGVLCSPFRLPILLNLNLSYKKSTLPRFQCTLSVAKENWQRNWDEFMYDFTNGGWDRWLNVTTQQQNNPYGAYLMAWDEMQSRRAIAQEKKKTEASFGSGFVSLQECSGDISGDIGQEKMCNTQCGHLEDSDDCFNSCMKIEGWDENLSSAEKCKLAGEQMRNTTPGKVIADELTKGLDVNADQLVNADELNEAIAAIINALINQLATSGLKSMADESHGGTGDWQKTSPTQPNKQAIVKSIDYAISTEIKYRNVKQSSLNAVNQTIDKVKVLKGCYDSLISRYKTSDPSSASELQGLMDTYITPILNYLNNNKISLGNDITNANSLITQVEGVKQQIKNATTYAQIDSLLKKLNDEIMPSMHDAQAIENAESEKEYLLKELNMINEKVDNLYQSCLAELGS